MILCSSNEWEDEIIDSEFQVTDTEIQRSVEPTEIKFAEGSVEKNILR